jgi:hypothetical protein
MKGVNTMRTHSMISFIYLLSKKSTESVFGKCSLILTACIISFFFNVIALVSPAYAQQVLFDFNNAPLYSSLPLYQTAGGITAHLSPTGQGYSIQNANALGFTPQGFDGRIIYPNSIYLANLLIHFDHTITDFSIMCCTQELACDDAATVRVTAYMNGSYVGYTDRMAICPCTWPVDTLMCIFPQGFDSVVVHYQAPPPTCQDYGVVMLFDNMRVTPSNVGIKHNSSDIPKEFRLYTNYPNPFNPVSTIKFDIPKISFTKLIIFDILGREVATLVNEQLKPGAYSVVWDATNYPSGVYFYRINASDFTDVKKMILIK